MRRIMVKKGLAVTSFVLLALMQVVSAAAQSQDEYEVPPVFQASKVLPPDLGKDPTMKWTNTFSMMASSISIRWIPHTVR